MKRAMAMLTGTALLAACVTPAPLRPAAQGSEVPLDHPVRVGALVARPLAVSEDSRCPQNARCVWAGQLVVVTRIAGDGWAETARLRLGERYPTHGTWILLASGRPEKRAEAPTPRRDYRFTFEGG